MIGLAKLSEDVVKQHAQEQHEEITFTNKALVARRHEPPTSGAEGILSPVLAKLDIINPNSDNVQYLDSYGVSWYLANYVVSVDKNHQMYVKCPNERLESDVRVYGQKTGNTKICSIQADVRNRNQRSKCLQVGRAMSQPESLMLLWNIPQVYTDIKFVHLSTHSLEERAGFETQPRVLTLPQSATGPNP